MSILSDLVESKVVIVSMLVVPMNFQIFWTHWSSQDEANKLYHDADVDKYILNDGLVNLGCWPMNFRNNTKR